MLSVIVQSLLQTINSHRIYFFLLLGAIISVIAKKLTVAGGITGFIIASLIFIGAGYGGIAMLTLFFVLGSGATGWQSRKKQQTGIAQPGCNRRTAGQVIANGGVAAICGWLAWYKPENAGLFQLMIAGSIASATADTLSSELGSIYGRRFYDVITFKKVNPGPDGVVSLEGTLIGIAGAVLISIVYALGFGWNRLTGVIIIAGAIGNLSDSLLGATAERSKLIGNNTVNFLNTSIGAFTCILLQWLIR